MDSSSRVIPCLNVARGTISDGCTISLNPGHRFWENRIIKVPGRCPHPPTCSPSLIRLLVFLIGIDRG